MPSKKLLFVILLLTVLITVLARLPASAITDKITIPGTAIDGVSGTIWSGQIDALVINQEPIAPIGWSLHPLSLLRGKIAADVVVTPRDSLITGTVEGDFSGRNAILSNVVIDGQLRSIASGTSLGPIAGGLTASIDEVVVDQGWPTKLQGSVNIDNLIYPAGAPFSLGNFVLNCPGKNPEPLACQLNDNGGPIELDAMIRLTPERSYKLDGKIRTRAGANDDIVNGLQFLGAPGPDGFYKVFWQGDL